MLFSLDFVKYLEVSLLIADNTQCFCYGKNIIILKTFLHICWLFSLDIFQASNTSICSIMAVDLKQRDPNGLNEHVQVSTYSRLMKIRI